MTGLGLVLAHALVCLGQQRLNIPVFDPAWGPPLILLSLALLFWSYYNLGLWAGRLLFSRGQALPGGAAVAMVLGLMASMAILLVMGLFGLLRPGYIFALFGLILLASGPRLVLLIQSRGAMRDRAGEADRLWVGLGLLASVLLLASLFFDTALRGMFQSDAVDAFMVYLPEISSHLRTGDLARPYFLFQAHVFPWLFSSLLYLPVLALATVHGVPAFSLALVGLMGLLVFLIARRLVRPRMALLAPFYFFLCFFWLYYVDLGLNLLKYNHFLSILLDGLVIYLVLDFQQRGRLCSAVLGGVALGLMVAEFSLAFPVVLVWLAACLLVPALRRRLAEAPLKVVLAWGLPLVAIPLIPLAVNWFYTGLPADPVMAPVFLKWFTPKPEFWSPFFYGGQHAYPLAYATQTQIGLTILKMARFMAIPLAAVALALSSGAWRKEGAPLYLLVLLTLVWMVLLQHYISPKMRYLFLALPLLGITSALVLDHLARAGRRILPGASWASLAALVLVLAAGVWTKNITPPIPQLALWVDKAQWLADGYRVHHRVAREYQTGGLLRYIQKHVRPDEKIIVPQPGFLNSTLGRITLNPGTLPYYAMFLPQPREMLAALQKLGVGYLLLVRGKPLTGPYRPLLLQPAFAERHLQLVATANLRRYLFDDQAYHLREGRKHILESNNQETVYLFKISYQALRQSPAQEQAAARIAARIEILNTYTPDMAQGVRDLRFSPDLVGRLRSFDQKWAKSPGSCERLFASP